MAKTRRVREGSKYVAFRCPGCGHEHTVNIEQDGNITPWGFNGDYDNPTFTPSIKVTGICYERNEDDMPIIPSTRKESICHSFVTNGSIRFLGDCTHKLRGLTVELPDKY